MTKRRKKRGKKEIQFKFLKNKMRFLDDIKTFFLIFDRLSVMYIYIYIYIYIYNRKPIKIYIYIYEGLTITITVKVC